MLNFLGEYELTVDAKGRFMLPSGFRKQLPEGTDNNVFVVNRGFEHCLSLYTKESWDVLAQKLSSLNDFNPKVREFKRLFMNGANILEADSTGRVLLTKPLMEYARISKDIVMNAQGNKMEIWDKDSYYAYINKATEGFSELAEEVAGSDFFNKDINK